MNNLLNSNFKNKYPYHYNLIIHDLEILKKFLNVKTHGLLMEFDSALARSMNQPPHGITFRIHSSSSFFFPEFHAATHQCLCTRLESLRHLHPNTPKHPIFY